MKFRNKFEKPIHAFLISLLAAGILHSAPASPPNIIIILADDMGYGDPAYAGGKIATPHLDRLAKEGMQFSDAHTSSAVCTPTRYGILTKRYKLALADDEGCTQRLQQTAYPRITHDGGQTAW